MRLMVWNINRFTGNSLNRNFPYNQWYVLETVYGQALDIFVVVEVQSSQGVRGSLIRGGGKTGSLELLEVLRAESGAPDWRLVPPLRLVQGVIGQTYTEGISVFYNNDTLNFTGPNYWNAKRGISTPNDIGTQYPNPWNAVLPNGNNRAGKVDFTHYYFGSTVDFPNSNNRRPFYTEFVERGGEKRNIKLLSVHLPPNQADAALAMSRLIDIDELHNLGSKDVVIAAGDFNFNLIKFGQKYLDTARAEVLFKYFRPIQFTLTTGATRVEKISDATLAGAAPGYGYLLNDFLDNIFVRYGSGLTAPTHNELVVNRVVGSGPNYPVDMSISIPSLLNDVRINDTERLSIFQEEYNYGHIAHFGGVSDHLPLVMDI